MADASPEGEPAAEGAPAPAPVVRKRRRFEPAEETEPAATVPRVSPALAALAPSLSGLAGGGAQPAAAAPPAAPAMSLDAATQQAANEAVQRMNQMLMGNGAAGAAGAAASAGIVARPFQADIDINDSAMKGLLTRKQTQEEITAETGANILIRGRYKPPGDTSAERALHLHIEAETQAAPPPTLPLPTHRAPQHAVDPQPFPRHAVAGVAQRGGAEDQRDAWAERHGAGRAQHGAAAPLSTGRAGCAVDGTAAAECAERGRGHGAAAARRASAAAADEQHQDRGRP